MRPPLWLPAAGMPVSKGVGSPSRPLRYGMRTTRLSSSEVK